MSHHSNFLEINKKNLIFNYNYLNSLSDKNLTAATIKANAYGLGDIEAFKMLYNAGCKHFFLATFDEAIRIRKKYSYGFLYILNGINKDNIKKILREKNIIPIINSIDQLKLLNKKKLNNYKKFNFGIHIDTGINRLGINISDLQKITSTHKIKIIMSHLSSADESNNYYNKLQNNRFKKAVSSFKNIEILSFANSAGIKLGKEYLYNLTRPGIALYGGHNNTELRKKIKPVIKLKAEIIQIKKINKNQYVGYNQTFKTKKNTVIAIIAIGYGDGLPRSLSNNGYVYYKKKKFKIIGRVSMDTCTIDITRYHKFLKIGKFVDIINYQYDVEKFAKKCSTISNEILTSITPRVKRIYI